MIPVRAATTASTTAAARAETAHRRGLRTSRRRPGPAGPCAPRALPPGGTRRVGWTVLVALVLGLGLEALRLPIGLAGIALDWGGLGYIVPGLIAHQIDRQGWVPTAAMVVLAAAIVRLAAMITVRL